MTPPKRDTSIDRPVRSREASRAPRSERRGVARAGGRGVAAVMAVVLGAFGLMGVAGRTVTGGTPVSLIVMTRPGAEAAAVATVLRNGGRVTRSLGIINGFTASVPARAAGLVARTAGVVSATENQAVHLMMDADGGGSSSDGGSSSGDNYDARSDGDSMFNIENRSGARALWQATTGAGVDVALIDSGVAPVLGLSDPGKVLNGPDLTEESQNPALAHLDTFGHGTHMAGIIAGHDPGVSPSGPGNSGAFLGVAPDARIVSVKVADVHGNTDVSQVIAGVDWVVQHAHDPGINIRVLNLSFGTDSAQSYRLDPLAFAVEQAWLHGIVVVTSAGNAGATLGHLTDPANDPYVIAVGAADDHGTVSPADDTISSFSSWGDGTRNPDLVAPGAHVQSLRVPGSYIDQTYGSTGTINARFFRGSGTSQAAAAISGAAALLIQARPSLTPDQVKTLLVSHTALLPGLGVRAQGAGLIGLHNGQMKAAVPQTFPRSVGTGTLDGARGTSQLVLHGVALTGEVDIFGRPVDTAALAAAEAAGSSWSGGTWNGSSWSGSSWSGSSWSGSSWSGSSWSGSSWSSEHWASATWTGSSWSGSSWSGSSWSGSSWSQDMWSVDGWS
ncbi:MAG: serine protease AprX [Acidimicrobiaceae bacterium]|nr:serine protease AprX [Acidimicrobiaceae bacterium]